jgi:hypothetical protein
MTGSLGLDPTRQRSSSCHSLSTTFSWSPCLGSCSSKANDKMTLLLNECPHLSPNLSTSHPGVLSPSEDRVLNMPARFPSVDSIPSTAFDEVPRQPCYNYYVTLAFLAAVGLACLTRRGLCDKSDPYYQKWLKRPQEAASSQGPST